MSHPAFTVVWIAGGEPHEPWLERLADSAPEHRYLPPGQWDEDTHADVALVGGPPTQPFSLPASLRLVQSVWAGVDTLLPHIPLHIPLARLTDREMVSAMSEAVLAHVLAGHRHHDDYARAQARRAWAPQPWRRRSDRVTGVLGLGQFGSVVAGDLRDAGFAVRGWSARPKRIAGVATYAGEDGLAEFLSPVEIAVCLLPLTPATAGVLDARTLGWLPRGAVLINVARGGHVVEQDLLESLASGRLRHAVLDVFDPEPLPAEHPYWRNDRITITPHVAAPSFVDSGVKAVLENIERVAAGRPPRDLVDRDRHY